MGMYLNPGSGLFKMTLASQAFVDKTGIVALANERIGTEKRYLAVSRPRRFGKTVAANTLAAYYDRTIDTLPLFLGKKAAAARGFEEHLNKYDVVRVNIKQIMADAGTQDVDEALAFLERRVSREIKRFHPEADIYVEDGLIVAMSDAHLTTGVPFVVIIDEWDAPFRVDRNNTAMHKRYLDWLSGLMKDREYLALGYVTGILPPQKYGEHSALNMFSEVSMTNAAPYEDLMGFTDDDVLDLCEQFHMDIDTMRLWYDGYLVGSTAVYNPHAVTEAVTRHNYWNYWTSTERFSELERYISMDRDGLRQSVVRMLAGESVPVDVTAFNNDLTTFRSADDVLTCLIHLGYLTFNIEDQTVRIPNREVTQQFATTLRQDRWPGVAAALIASNDLVKATYAGDQEGVAQFVAAAHIDAASVLTFNDENSLACSLSLAYYALRDTHRMFRELPAGVGFADIVFVPRRGVDAPALVVELKWNNGADSAIRQIHERRYVSGVEGLAGECLLVAISYDKTDRNKDHHCVIERVTL